MILRASPQPKLQVGTCVSPPVRVRAVPLDSSRAWRATSSHVNHGAHDSLGACEARTLVLCASARMRDPLHACHCEKYIRKSADVAKHFVIEQAGYCEAQEVAALQLKNFAHVQGPDTQACKTNLVITRVLFHLTTRLINVRY